MKQPPAPRSCRQVDGSGRMLALKGGRLDFITCALHHRGEDCAVHGQKPRLPWEDARP